ncbi:MAG: DUF11 domain-containing protein [Candidatus Doudnabacteria bacterium]|nr:DUF11 domain-containing protein [Candidatus Doudnabacteria bacterium]
MNAYRTKEKIAVLAILLLAGFTVAAKVFADGPVLNSFPIGYSGAQNTDYPLLDARNVTAGGSFSSSQADHDDGVTASAGDTIEFILYYHNGAADAAENVANNVRARASWPAGSNANHVVSASLSADNAATVYSAGKGGDVVIKVGGIAQSMEYVSGSTLHFPNRSTSGQSLGDGIVTSSGLLLGNIRGCWDFSGFVKFRARVGQSAVGSLQIDKTVTLVSAGSYQNSIDAQPADVVRFRIVTRANNADVSDVIIRDILPSSLTYRSNTTRVNGLTVSDSTGFFGSGYTYGLLSKDQSVEITFEAQVASASFFGSNPQTLVNTANARGANVSTAQDTAEVRVAGQVLGTSFQLSKSAFNQTQGVAAQNALANPGDVINYTLTYQNTGGTNLTGVVIEDDIIDVLRSADLLNYGDGSLSGNVVRFPAITVPAGIAISRTFQVRIRDYQAGQTDFTMTNVYGNQVDIQLRQPVVKGTFIAPKTGTRENVVVILSLLVTGSWYAASRLRRRHQVKSVMR